MHLSIFFVFTSCHPNSKVLRIINSKSHAKFLVNALHVCCFGNSFRTLFNWASKLIPQLLWFCIATLCDWLKNLAPLLDQSEVKPIVIYSHAFSRAWHGRHVFASSSDWFIWLFTTVVIGQIITLVLVLRHSNKNRSILYSILKFLAVQLSISMCATRTSIFDWVCGVL